jgi:hypothetical protein
MKHRKNGESEGITGRGAADCEKFGGTVHMIRSESRDCSPARIVYQKLSDATTDRSVRGVTTHS